jgi:hypothetical protein
LDKLATKLVELLLENVVKKVAAGQELMTEKAKIKIGVFLYPYI